MKIFLTGAFGNVGLAVIEELFAHGHETYIFDLKNKKNKNLAKKIKHSYTKLIWGDIRDDIILEKAVTGCECIIHLAAIVPPESEKSKSNCDEINSGGTNNIIKAALSTGGNIPLVYVSSASVMGPTQDKIPPLSTNNAPNPTTYYAKSKMTAEKSIRNSGLDYCILRLASVMDSGSDYSEDMLKLLFEFPLSGRNEIILDTDAAKAIVVSAEKITNDSNLKGKIFFIGGGSKNGCQITNRDMISGMFTAMGIGMLSEKCFTTDFSEYSMDWYDTTESNNILDYQDHTLEDYIKIVEKKTESGGFFVKYMAPRLKSAMEVQSPYYKNNN